MGNGPDGEPYFRERRPSTLNRAPEGFSNALDLKAHAEEQTNFADFKKTQKSNPCFASLPWPKIPAGKANVEPYKNYKYYPYAIEAQAKTRDGYRDYSLRTNLRLNNLYAHLNATRVAETITKAPDYKVIQYYLLLEETGCLTPEDQTELKTLMPDLDVLPKPSALFAYGRPEMNPLLYGYAKKIGLKDEDWTLEFKKHGTNYRTGAAGDTIDDLFTKDLVMGDLLKDVGAKNPALGVAPEDATSRGVEKSFGADFDCIDKLGGGIKNAYKDRSKNQAFCQKLHDENKKNIDFLKATGQCEVTSSAAAKATDLKKAVETAVLKLDAASVARGKALVAEHGEGACVTCHSPTAANKNSPKDFLFLPNDTLDAKANQDALGTLKTRMQEGYLDQVKERVVKDQDMPPGTNKLTPTNRQDIVNYIQSLSP